VQYAQSRFHSTWDAVGVAAGVAEQFEQNLEMYYRTTEWDKWAQADAALLKGKNFEEIKRKTLGLVPYSPGVKELFGQLSSDFPLLRKGILSNGVGFVAKEVCQDLKMNFYLADELMVKEGRFTGEITAGMPDRDKRGGLEMVRKQENISLDQICYVGDHENDLVVFEQIGLSQMGLSVAFNPKTDKVRDAADYVIYDFKDLLDLIGLKLVKS
jgi:phosphoserine phosphatase